MTRKTVLVVDDHAPTREAYAAFLADCGYRVLQASHGGEAILQVHLHRPDVVLMDIAMPVLDGVQTAESLRACVPTRHVRIVGVTGSASTFERERMTSLCDALLLKPCAPDEVAARIRSLMEVAA
jgi:CheY-like chemotaxis protein